VENETNNNLKSIFDKYDKKQSKAREERAKEKSEKELFLDNFAKKVQDVIQPAFDEVAELIKSRGHDCKITIEQESQDTEGHTQSAQIRMSIYPNGQRPQSHRLHECPSISFIAGSQAKKVFTHVSTMMLSAGGTSGTHNEYLLENITKEIVEKEVIYLLSECFGK